MVWVLGDGVFENILKKMISAKRKLKIIGSVVECKSY
jgi:hypothetical protein